MRRTIRFLAKGKLLLFWDSGFGINVLGVWPWDCHLVIEVFELWFLDCYFGVVVLGLWLWKLGFGVEILEIAAFSITVFGFALLLNVEFRQIGKQSTTGNIARSEPVYTCVCEPIVSLRHIADRLH